ncbi:MAG: hypothetical protein M3Z21_16580 [Pseudomonadota bacterium]|nr:hypothetical protein [Pseudomonadota bacterium]
MLPYPPRAFGLLLAAGLAGCALLERPSPAPVDREYPVATQGYTLLYEVVSKQKLSDKLLLIKIESDAVDAVIGEIAEDAARIEDQLKDIARQDPEIDLDRPILPEMEVRKRASVQAERLKDLLGSTGRDFERLLLLTQSGTLNQTRHLAREMVKAESDPQRKAFWEDVQRQYDDNYANLVQLLEAQYFTH